MQEYSQREAVVATRKSVEPQEKAAFLTQSFAYILGLVLDLALLCLAVNVVFTLARDLLKNRWQILFEVRTYLEIYAIAYFVLPSLLLVQVNEIQSWNFGTSTLLLSKAISLFFAGVVVILCSLGKMGRRPLSLDFRPSLFSARIGFVLLGVIVLYSAVVLLSTSAKLVSISNDRIASAEMYLDIADAFQLKKVQFLLLAAATIVFWRWRNPIVFLAVVPLLALELLSGGRTTTFFVIVFVYLNLVAKYHKVWAAKIAVVLVILLVFTTANRLQYQGVVEGRDLLQAFTLTSLGEFIQTYMTLPYLLETGTVSSSPILQMVAVSLAGLLPGSLRATLDGSFLSPGSEIAAMIGRGYGLAFNSITESLYYFGILGIILAPIVMVLLARLVESTSRRSGFSGFVFLVLFIVYLRLLFREGVFTYILSVPFVYTVYFVPLYLLVHIKASRRRISRQFGPTVGSPGLGLTGGSHPN